MIVSRRHYTFYNLPEIRPLTRREIIKYVGEPKWQRIRVSMKGKTTHEKLLTLEKYWRDTRKWADNLSVIEHRLPETWERLRAARVQIINYLNALKRGGQLDQSGYIRKER